MNRVICNWLLLGRLLGQHGWLLVVVVKYCDYATGATKSAGLFTDIASHMPAASKEDAAAR